MINSKVKKKTVINLITGTPLEKILDDCSLKSDSWIETKPDIDEKTSSKKKLTAKEKLEARKIKYEEHYTQAEIIKRWNYAKKKGVIPMHWLLFRNANTQFLNITGIVWNKAEGMLAGIPDLTLVIDQKVFFIEMKKLSRKPKTIRGESGRRGLNDEQLEVFPKFEKCGFKPIICYSEDEAIETIEKLTGIFLPKVVLEKTLSKTKKPKIINNNLLESETKDENTL